MFIFYHNKKENSREKPAFFASLFF